MTTLLSLLLSLQLWTPSHPPSRDIFLEGSWQSCLGGGGYNEDNSYAEKAFEFKTSSGWKLWAFHMGPKNDFAFFDREHDRYGDEDNHDSEWNLLKPLHVVTNVSPHKNWFIPKFDLVVDVRLAGGSRDECESYFVSITKYRNY